MDIFLENTPRLQQLDRAAARAHTHTRSWMLCMSIPKQLHEENGDKLAPFSNSRAPRCLQVVLENPLFGSTILEVKDYTLQTQPSS